MKLLWLTDLHLDQTEESARSRFFWKLRNTAFDAAVITGDISSSCRLVEDLKALSHACAPRPVYFVLGNHDFYGSSFADVDTRVNIVCKTYPNLIHLGQGEVIPLSEKSCLIGHRGWADGIAGVGSSSLVHNRDAFWINDLESLPRPELFDKMKTLGRASGRYFLDWLPEAFEKFERVWIATHVPPFEDAATFNGRLGGSYYLPHYSNVSAGAAIRNVAKRFREKQVSVLAGHTHSAANVRLWPGISVNTGATGRGHPRLQMVIDVV